MAKFIWSAIESATSLKITPEKILTVGNTQGETLLISVIAYLIYKYYLLQRQYDRNNWKNDIRFFYQGLQNKICIYSKIPCFNNILTESSKAAYGLCVLLY